jgi:hypothetical protein
MTDAERWQAYLDMATALKASHPSAPATGGIVGRFITVLAKRLARFWKDHRDTLIPHLTATAIAALEAVAAEIPNIIGVNPPGPT